MCSQRYLFHSVYINTNVFAGFVNHVVWHLIVSPLLLFVYMWLRKKFLKHHLPYLSSFINVCRVVCFNTVCLCMCENERIGPVSHLIVIASVFGLETVDRNQQWARWWWWWGYGGLCLPLPSVLVVMHPSTNRDQGITDSGYLYWFYVLSCWAWRRPHICGNCKFHLRNVTSV